MKPDQPTPSQILNRNLRSIYEENGKLPDMSRMDRMRKKTLTRFFINAIALILVGTGIVWFGLSLFSPGGGNGGASLSIEAPQDIKTESKITLRFKYTNQDRKPLALAVLKVRYPKDFVPERSTPVSDDETMTSWTIGAMPRNTDGVIEVEGRVHGSMNSQVSIQAALTYKPADFNAEFTSVAKISLNINQSPLELVVDMPSAVMAGESVALKIRYKNVSDDIFDKLTLVVALPPTFIIDATDPAPAKENGWALPKLSPQDEGSVSIHGVFASEATGDNPIKFSVLSPVKRDQIIIAQQEQIITVEQGKMLVRLKAYDDPRPVSLGEVVPIVVEIENQGDDIVADMRLVVACDSALIDWPSVKSNESITVQKGSVTWIAKDVPALKTIKSKGTAKFGFAMRLTSSAVTGSATSINCGASLSFGKVGDKKVTTTVKSTMLNLSTGSNFDVTSVGNFYDAHGVQIGSGPIPPKVGIETKYRITWRIDNTFHEINNIVLEAPLGDSVVFSGKVNVGAGVLSFVPDKKTVRWDLSRLPTTISDIEAVFDVAITPKDTDRGNAMVLLGETKASANDIVINQTVTSKGEVVNTQIIHDAKGANKGIVQ